jgi:micrococcal nuclease
VVDGDTIKVAIGGQVHTVRYIGIDTPETVHPERPVEWMGAEADAANTRLVAGRVVRLERDVSDRDRHGRLLRYVWVGEVMVNAELVRLGYAEVSTYPPNVKYQDLFLRLQAEARDARRGLWSTPPTATPAPTEPPREGCDPAYPDVCLPPPPPNLDCGDIPYRRFRVLPPDPHLFDVDEDGIGCEST